MCPSRTPPGANPPSVRSPKTPSRLAAYDVGALRSARSSCSSAPAASTSSSMSQPNARARVAGQRGGEGAGVGLVVGVRLGEAGPLHLLGGLGDLHGLVAVDLGQGVVERVGRVVRVEDLLRRAPALRRPLLEQPERVAVAGLEVGRGRTPGTPWPARSWRPGRAARGAPRSRRSARRSRPARRSAPPGGRRPRRCTRRRRGTASRCRAARRSRRPRRPPARRPPAARHPPACSCGKCGGAVVAQLACRSALSAMPSRFHGTASIAPVTELRRNSTLSAPESSAALITLGLPSMSAIVTLVPAVT